MKLPKPCKGEHNAEAKYNPHAGSFGWKKPLYTLLMLTGIQVMQRTRVQRKANLAYFQCKVSRRDCFRCRGWLVDTGLRSGIWRSVADEELSHSPASRWERTIVLSSLPCIISAGVSVLASFRCASTSGLGVPLVKRVWDVATSLAWLVWVFDLVRDIRIKLGIASFGLLCSGSFWACNSFTFQRMMRIRLVLNAIRITEHNKVNLSGVSYDNANMQLAYQIGP